MSDTENRNEMKEREISASSAFGEEPDPSGYHRTSDEIYVGQQYQSSSEKKEEKKDSIAKDISILVMITLVAGCLLGAAYGVTKGPIARAQEAARARAQSEVMRGADHFEVLYSAGDGQSMESFFSEDVIKTIQSTGLMATKIEQIDGAYDAKGNLTGYVITADDPDGYGGNVKLMCGITRSGNDEVTLEGISFLAISETAGMGMRAKEESFTGQFAGMKLKEGELIRYTKSGASKENEIDAISGCTITTSAVTDDVNAALIAAWSLPGEGEKK